MEKYTFNNAQLRKEIGEILVKYFPEYINKDGQITNALMEIDLVVVLAVSAYQKQLKGSDKKPKEFVETFHCNHCEIDFGRYYADFKWPLCPSCGDDSDLTETTDGK